MGNNSSKQEVKKAIDELDLSRLQKFFSSPEGESFDVYELNFKNPANNEADPPVDCISYLLYRSPKPSSLPYLKLFKQHIEKLKQKSVSSSQHQMQWICHAELLVSQNPRDLEAFKFILDNLEIFPLVVVSSSSSSSAHSMKNGKTTTHNNNRTSHKQQRPPPALLHQLCGQKEAIELLREFISSGKIDGCYKNKNKNYSDDDTNDELVIMKLFGMTPLMVAAERFNADAVRELCVNQIGGNNYIECMEVLVNQTSENSLFMDDEAAADIALTLLAQPGGGSAIRDHIIAFGNIDPSISIARFDNGTNNKITANNSLHALLDIELKSSDFQHYERKASTGGMRPSLATAALWNGELDKLFVTLVGNGCRQLPTTHLQSRGLKEACRTGNVEAVQKILVELEFHRNVINVQGRTSEDQMTAPIAMAIENEHVEIVKMLLACGGVEVVPEVRKIAEDKAKNGSKASKEILNFLIGEEIKEFPSCE